MDETLADERVASRSPGAGPPATIGRYTVLRRLGAGGMGVVYAAYDNDLDRRVAVKLLHRELHEVPETSRGTSRLLREAQAMAKISHPNVLQVYEVGTHAGQVFLALEYVEGATLGEWCAAAPRAWREILEKFIQAGEGLHAAHCAGIIHRDFKPGNVLVDLAGRVRVMDFGLARAAGTEAPATPDALQDTRSTNSLKLSLTLTGATVGTPAYMAPEQFHALPVDARSDEFSLCVALWEALHGARPFPGDDLHELIHSVLDGQVSEPPRGTRVPGWIRRVLHRGLARAPDDRYPTVAALLTALRADPAARRRRVALAVLMTTFVGAGVYSFLAAAAAARAACDGGDARFAEVWGPGRAAELAAAFTATGRPAATAAATRVRDALDARATAWAAGHRDACESHRRGEQSDELLDLRMACLERLRDEVAAQVEVFIAADGAVVDRAADALSGLGDPAACADLDALRARVPPPTNPELRDAVAAARRRLAAALATSRAGRYKPALALADPEVDAAKALGYRPLEAEAALASARILSSLGRGEDALAAVLRAVWAAEASRHDELAADAWILAMKIAGSDLARFEDSDRWYERASAAIARLGDPPRKRADLDLARGAVEIAHHRFSEALAALEAALPLLQRSGADDVVLANLHNNIGNALINLGRYDEAEGPLTRALELRVATLGELHPEVAASHNNRGVLYRRTRQFDGALVEFERAEAIWSAILGPDSPQLVHTLQNQATVKFDLHDYEASARLLRRADELATRSLPPDSPVVSSVRGNLASLEMVRGDYLTAEVLLSAEIARREAIYGPDSNATSDMLVNLGAIRLARGDLAGAREVLTSEAVRTRPHLRRIGALHTLVALEMTAGELDAAEAYLVELEAAITQTEEHSRELPLAYAAELALRRGHPDRALALVRELDAVPPDTSLLEENLAAIRFIRARVLWASNVERPRARAEAEAALAFLRTRPQYDPRQRTAIESWLADHRL